MAHFTMPSAPQYCIQNGFYFPSRLSAVWRYKVLILLTTATATFIRSSWIVGDVYEIDCLGVCVRGHRLIITSEERSSFESTNSLPRVSHRGTIDLHTHTHTILSASAYQA